MSDNEEITVEDIIDEEKPYRVEFLQSNYTLRVSHREERFPIAFASISIEDMDGKKTGRLHSLLRHPDYKGLGICFDLACERLEIAKSLQCVQVYTAVYNERKGIIEMYKKMGFVEIEPLTPEYTRLIRPLNDINLEKIENWKGCGINNI